MQSPARRQANQFYWKPYFQFQSHEPGFDFLKSLPIDEKINKMQFSKPVKDGVVLLTTNGNMPLMHRSNCAWKTPHVCLRVCVCVCLRVFVYLCLCAFTVCLVGLFLFEY